MVAIKNCLTYPALQKFYNALSSLDAINPDNYIFENIPKIDTFFQEFRNITFVMQKSFNTPELKAFYKSKRDAYLLNDTMKWFIDARNETTKHNPFRLEKAISLKTYVAANNFEELKTLLTIDRDKNLSDLLTEVSTILENRYKNWFEVFFSISILFIENGKEVDIYKRIVDGTITMWKFISDVCNTYPCSCVKCKNLNTKIKSILNNIQPKQLMLFVQDCYYNNGEIQTGSQVNLIMKKNEIEILDTKEHRLDLTPVFGKYFCNNDINLLQKFASWHIALAQAQTKQTKKEPEILATFFLIYEDNTIAMIGPFGGTIKTTFYRTANEIAEQVKKGGIRAVLHVCEIVRTPSSKLKDISQKPANERQKEATGTMLCTIIASKQLENIMGIWIDYSQINDTNYLLDQAKKPEDFGNNFLIGPIFKAIKGIS